jgi:hypothetical protein
VNGFLSILLLLGVAVLLYWLVEEFVDLVFGPTIPNRTTVQTLDDPEGYEPLPDHEWAAIMRAIEDEESER